MSTTLGIAFSVTVIVIITTLLLRRQLREKYAIMWLVIGFAMLLLSLVPVLLLWLSDLLGVLVPSNLLFALALVLLVGVSLHLSWELSLAEDEIRRVAEETAILRAQLEALLERVERLTGGGEDEALDRGSDEAGADALPGAKKDPPQRDLDG